MVAEAERPQEGGLVPRTARRASGLLRRLLLRPLGRLYTKSGFDQDDLEAVTAVGVYLALGTIITAWLSSMYLLVRLITGV